MKRDCRLRVIVVFDYTPAYFADFTQYTLKAKYSEFYNSIYTWLYRQNLYL